MPRPPLGALVPVIAVLACAQPAPPPQPVPFSHKVHAGVNGIGCRMCHAYAEHAPVAGIPSMARCFGCHKFVARDKQDVQLVIKTYQDGRYSSGTASTASPTTFVSRMNATSPRASRARRATGRCRRWTSCGK